jgi:hypothetical protein
MGLSLIPFSVYIFLFHWGHAMTATYKIHLRSAVANEIEAAAASCGITAHKFLEQLAESATAERRVERVEAQRSEKRPATYSRRPITPGN